MIVSSAHRSIIAALMLAAACSRPPSSTTTSSSSPPAGGAAQPQPAAASQQAAEGQTPSLPLPADVPMPVVESPYDALPEESRALLEKPFTGDFDEMVKRRLIRAGVVYNRTQYFIDKGVQRGISYESMKLFEEELNKRLKLPLDKHVHLAIVPLSRDKLFSSLNAGKVDLVAAAITITPSRMTQAAFSTPTRKMVSEVVVTSANGPAIATTDDLSGREVFVRRSSSFYESLTDLNKSLASRGKAPVIIKEAPEALETDDILEMVNAGLVDVTIADDFVADFWRQVFPNIRIQKTSLVRNAGEIAIAVRKDNPKMLNAVNMFIKEYGPGTAFGNIVNRRYLVNTSYVKNAASDEERKKFQAVVKLFETYGKEYDVDYLLMAAQGFQESRLDQSAKSHVGAVGVMQVMPDTGKDLAVGDINQVEPNIHAGVKYFRFMMDTFYKNDPMDRLNKGLMTLAAYNAGPGRIRQLRAEAARRGLDPNVWFGNVERVVSEKVGRETVQYVSNIYKYYIAYKLVLDREQARAKARGDVKKAS